MFCARSLNLSQLTTVLRMSSSPVPQGTLVRLFLRSHVGNLCIDQLFFFIGSHVVYVLQKTRRYKVISIDNHHNSNSACLDRVTELTKSELPSNATDEEKLSAEIDIHRCDLTNPDQIRAVFEKYGKGGIWGVVHIAVSFGHFCCPNP